jgi:hypothetical protein
MTPYSARRGCVRSLSSLNGSDIDSRSFKGLVSMLAKIIILRSIFV